jgi:hypothetical protein
MELCSGTVSSSEYISLGQHFSQFLFASNFTPQQPLPALTPPPARPPLETAVPVESSRLASLDLALSSSRE